MFRRKNRAASKETRQDRHAPQATVDKIRRNLEEAADTSVKEIMTPRTEIVALEIPVTPEAVLEAVSRSGHSRFPVYHDDLDNLLGVLFLKDLLRTKEFWGNAQGDGGPRLDPIAFSRLLRPPYYVPESRAALEVLSEMQRQRRDFGVVLDEHGSVSGVVTIKDIVGRLVGDLPDEFDAPDPPLIVRVDRERWLVDGTCPVEQVRKELGVPIPEGDYVTIGGYVMAETGEVPEKGQTVRADGFSLDVVEVEKRRVSKVVLHFPQEKST